MENRSAALFPDGAGVRLYSVQRLCTAEDIPLFYRPPFFATELTVVIPSHASQGSLGCAVSSDVLEMLWVVKSSAIGAWDHQEFEAGVVKSGTHQAYDCK